LWPVIPLAIVGWVNQRVLRYDALAEHATAVEMRQVFAGRPGTLYALGVVLALLAYVPFVGFFAPVVFGLSFIHYLLAALKVHRESPIEGRVL
jgi:CysZ protein